MELIKELEEKHKKAGTEMHPDIKAVVDTIYGLEKLIIEENAPSPEPAPEPHIVMAEDLPDIDIKFQELENKIDKLESVIKLCCPDFDEFDEKARKIQSRFKSNKIRKETYEELENKIDKLESVIKLCCPDFDEFDEKARKIQSRFKSNKIRKETYEELGLTLERYKTKGEIIISPPITFRSGEYHELSLKPLSRDFSDQLFSHKVEKDLVLYNCTGYPVYFSMEIYNEKQKNQSGANGDQLIACPELR